MESPGNNEVNMFKDDGNNIKLLLIAFSLTVAKLLRNWDEVQCKRNKINLQISVKYVLPEQYCSFCQCNLFLPLFKGM